MMRGERDKKDGYFIEPTICVAHALRAGTVWINSYRTLSFNMPFGGYKMSGMGRENGLESLKDYTQVKSGWVERRSPVEGSIRLLFGSWRERTSTARSLGVSNRGRE